MVGDGLPCLAAQRVVLGGGDADAEPPERGIEGGVGDIGSQLAIDLLQHALEHRPR